MTDPAQVSLWLTVLLPAATGAALVLTPRVGRAAAAVSLAVASITVVLSALVAVHKPSAAVPYMAGADFALTVDPLAALVLPAVTVVTLLVLVVSTAEIRRSQARFHGLMLIFASAAVLTVTASTLATLLLAWEIMGATSYALVGFWWQQEHRVSAGLTAFVTTRAADLGLYLAAAAALAGGAGLDLADLPDAGEGWRHVVALGVLVAALGKAAQLPFSFWLSRAMEGPSPVSALLHSAAMVAMGGYLLLRVEPLLSATGWAAVAAAWVGALTALLLGAVAVAQRDLKQLLAASTCAQLGFVVMGAGLGSVAGGAAHLVAHASTKALLFLAAGVWLTALGTQQLAGLHGAARRWRVVGWSATVGALALAGIAPLSLWATKDAVLAVALEESAGLYAVGLAAAALSAAYAGKVLVVIWRRLPSQQQGAVADPQDEDRRSSRTPGRLEQMPLIVLAAGAATLGVLALSPVGDTLAGALDQTAGPHATPLELGVSATVALLVVLTVTRWRLPEPQWAMDWLGLERVAHVVVARPTMHLARALARFDDDVLDRSVDASSSSTLRAAQHAARVDDGLVDGAVEGLAARLRQLGELARRPQTGQLHQYYVQAVAVLAALVLVLVAVR